MSAPTTLKEMERESYASKFEDGLWEISLGLLIVGVWFFSVLAASDEPHAWRRWLPLYAVCLVPIALFHHLAKRWITFPRIGRFKPGPARRRKICKALGCSVAAIAIQVALILFLREAEVGTRKVASLVIPPLLVFLPFAALAFWHDFMRGYFHALTMACAVILARTMDQGFPFLIAGSLVTFVGGVMLLRFLRRYPLPGEEFDYEG